MSKPAEKNITKAPVKADIISKLIKIMLWGALIAMAYVILKACSTPKFGFETFREGALDKLVVLDSPPARPATVFVDANGVELSLADKQGKVVLLNLWATWCAPCIAEIPSLNALQARYQKSEFEVVAVSLDRDIEDARGFLNQVGADNLALYHDKSFAIAKDAAATGVPVTILYNQAGRELARLSGEADWNSEQAVRLVNYALGR